MKEAVIYARVSSTDQEREGFSIPAQLKYNREYALKNGFHVVHEFVDIETAKTTGRKKFGEMLSFLSRSSSCRVLIVEKTDRLYRNFRDCVTLEWGFRAKPIGVPGSCRSPIPIDGDQDSGMMPIANSGMMPIS